MKKLLQIIGIAIGSLLGLVIAAASVAIWCIFTPDRLTPVVRQVADEYITCEWDMGEVDLTFFSTFPEFGLHVDGIYLVNPMTGSQWDTVLVAPSVVAKVDVMAYLKHKQLIVHEISLPDMVSHVYIDPSGATNFNVFYAPPDTTAKDTATAFPFDSIAIQRCVLSATQITFVDDKDTISATLNNTEIALKMADWEDIRLRLQADDVCATVKGEAYAQHVCLNLDLPFSMNLDDLNFHIHKAKISVNEFPININGDLTIGQTIPMDVQVDCINWRIAPLMTLLPPSVLRSLSDIEADGRLTLRAHAKGTYSSTSFPLIDAQVWLKNAHGSYAALPYTFNKVQLHAGAHLDLNNTVHSSVTVHQFTAATQHSHLDLQGCIADVLGAMQTEAQLTLDAALPDWAYFMPSTLTTQGRVQGKLDVQTCLKELIEQHYNSLAVQGLLHMDDFDLSTDSMQVSLGEGQIDMDMHLKEWPVITATIGLQSEQRLQVHADSLDVDMLAPQMTAFASYDIQDTTHIPTFKTKIEFADFKGMYTTYRGHLGKSRLEAKMTNARRNKTMPAFSATLSTCDLQVELEQNRFTAQNISMDMKAIYNKDGNNFLLQWNPLMQFGMNNAQANLADFELPIRVPQILFKYSNREFDIINSYVQIGQSDFSLSGQINHIGKWLMGKDMLTGELNFISEHTDANELMRLCSAEEGSEETPQPTETDTTATDTTSKEPFLVPLDVDLTLNTNIREALVFNQTLHNLGGKLYVKDGTLVLEEMGFACDAAKMQLTAMYRTPRRDYIYLGFDYHMVDVKIDQLIQMIPQVDSIVPMLRSFKGELEFHLAAETYMNEKYELKTSTLRGASSIFGKDLVVMDSETFNRISKKLLFKKKTENKVDSISAEITLSKNEINVYPFCVSIDNYMAALGGKHNLNNHFDYHIDLLSPFYLGVNIKGSMDHLSIKPGKCIYAKDFKPVVHNNVDTQNAEFRQMIRESLRKNVKIK